MIFTICRSMYDCAIEFFFGKPDTKFVLNGIEMMRSENFDCPYCGYPDAFCLDNDKCGFNPMNKKETH